MIQTAISLVTVLRTPDPIDAAAALVQYWAFEDDLCHRLFVDPGGFRASRHGVARNDGEPALSPDVGDIMLAGVNLPAGIAFYLIYPVGLVYFAILPALKSGSLAQAMLGGALFGFFTYMTYDLTNQATLRNWTTQLTLIDAGWGTLLGAIAAAAGFWVTIKLAV